MPFLVLQCQHAVWNDTQKWLYTTATWFILKRDCRGKPSLCHCCKISVMGHSYNKHIFAIVVVTANHGFYPIIYEMLTNAGPHQKHQHWQLTVLYRSWRIVLSAKRCQNKSGKYGMPGHWKQTKTIQFQRNKLLTRPDCWEHSGHADSHQGKQQWLWWNYKVQSTAPSAEGEGPASVLCTPQPTVREGQKHVAHQNT